MNPISGTERTTTPAEPDVHGILTDSDGRRIYATRIYSHADFLLAKSHAARHDAELVILGRYGDGPDAA